ncbi:hypothetical protein EJ05DRAFT_444564 [Pseudovirgaria hyperparasitica]|uniref:histone acetyltransferase n=1 Tax=Pseudovirgaria hyperparasitica TaxID=470096 RepID=A0A6A6VVG4_9PEZI|nr:uncharacterized protein EJ05DRAFT_444564 [Pseudovirgaria hyperparasitica]KAF2753610.1 hypothetical protein EJ05DRAFT_444564 [Pseudovirgaria hyperparasitica]
MELLSKTDGQQSHSPVRKTSGRPATEPVQPNIFNVVLGNVQIKPWFPSFYPEELVTPPTERLLVCQWCFKYSKEIFPYLTHTKVCPLRNGPPPGTKIYSKGRYTLHELDGEVDKLYAQNLSLFAKLFLDTKSVFYDVTTFLYYLLIMETPSSDGNGTSPQVVGFFSKEKMSWDNNNLACILVFPPWQRQGLGQVLMSVSYELSKREGRLGGPEKRMLYLYLGRYAVHLLKLLAALSTLGRLAYTNFWAQTLARVMLARHVPTPQSHQKNPPTTVRELSDITYIVPEDIVTTLQSMNLLDHKKRAGKEQAVIDKVKVRAWAEQNGFKAEAPIDLTGFIDTGRETAIPSVED